MNWEERYRSGQTPWDLGRSHPELERRLDEGLFSRTKTRRALVPGCGLGHDALALARAGWVVTAIDLVDATDGALGHELQQNGGRFLRTDALTFDEDTRFDLLWDHTFFCAIEPERRESWASMARRLAAPGGLVCGISFPEDKSLSEGGPPWGMSVQQLADLLLGFELDEVSVPRAGVERRRGRESWFTFVRSI